MPAHGHSKDSLAPQHLERLTKVGITDEVIKVRGYETVTTKSALGDLGYSRSQWNAPALVIPIYDAVGKRAGVQIRPDKPRLDSRAKPVKYESPPSSRPYIDVSPAARKLVDDPEKPLVITEGVIKADAAISRNISSVSIAGVQAWRPDDPFWTSIPLAKRLVFIAFDSDQATNLNVQKAAARLSDEFKRRGAVPKVLCLPAGNNGDKQGLDDYLAAGFTFEDLIALPVLDLAELAEEIGDKEGGTYQATSTGMIREIPKANDVLVIPLTNFNARITADTAIDNGSEVRHELEIMAEINGRTQLVQVPAEEFEQMNWIIPKLGADAIVHAGMVTRDHARVAIQSLSGPIAHKRLYEHLGWVKVQDRWVFLDADGVVGTDRLNQDRDAGRESGCTKPRHHADLPTSIPNGPIPSQNAAPVEVSVRVPPVLKNYRLPNPPQDTDLKAAVDFTLQILTSIAPLHLTLPLLAATFRIAVDTADFSLYLVGRTNVGKTVLVALYTQFFGRELHDRNLPGSWLSTSNQLLATAALAKNVIFPIDDYVPTGSQMDIDRANREADRVFRAQGNQTGRGRCNRDGTPKEGRSPQCLIIGTGEELPEGHSLNSRLLALEVKDGDVLCESQFPALSLAQFEARKGLFAGVMAAFIKWLQPRYEKERADMHAGKESFRELFRSQGRLARTVDIAADLLAGFDMFLAFCVEEAGMEQEKFDQLWEDMHDALNLILDGQAETTQEADPVTRFMGLLTTALTTGLAHLKGLDEAVPYSNQRLWGWEEKTRTVQEKDEDGSYYTTTVTHFESRGLQIGWVQHDQVYLEIDASLAVVQKLAKDSNLRPLPLTKRTLGKTLHAKGMLNRTSEDHYTTKIYIGEGQKRVLHMHQSKVIEFTSFHQPDQSDMDRLLGDDAA